MVDTGAGVDWEYLPYDQWEAQYYLTDRQRAQRTEEPFTTIFPPPTPASVSLGAICFLIWLGGFLYISRRTTDSGFGRFAARKIEAKIASRFHRMLFTLFLFCFELVQLTAVTFSPSVAWHPFFRNLVEGMRATFFVFPGKSYPFGFFLGVASFLFFMIALFVPLFFEWRNFQSGHRHCLWWANLFYRFPVISEALRDHFIFFFAVPWTIILTSPFACTHYKYEDARVTLSGETGVICWSNTHYVYVFLGGLCGVIFYFSSVAAGSFEYFVNRFTDIAHSGRYMSLQYQMKAFVGVTYVMFHESWPKSYLGCLIFAYSGLLYLNHASRPCLIEKINFHRATTQSMALWCAFIALVHTVFVEQGWREVGSITPFVQVLVGWALILTVAVANYFILPHKKAYPPYPVDEGMYQGDFLMFNSKRHGHGALLFKTGERFIGTFHLDVIHGRGILYDSLTATYYIGDWRNQRRHGYGRSRYLKCQADIEFDHGRDEPNQALGRDELEMCLKTLVAKRERKLMEDLEKNIKEHEEHESEINTRLYKNLPTEGDEEMAPVEQPAERELGESTMREATHGDGEELDDDAQIEQEQENRETEKEDQENLDLEQQEQGDESQDHARGDEGDASEPLIEKQEETPRARKQKKKGINFDDNQVVVEAPEISTVSYYYEGMWALDEPHGSGIKKFSDGESFVGHFRKGREHGFGSWTFQTGSGDFQGEWEDGQLKHAYPLADEYLGGWRYGLEHGQGSRCYTDGATYIGSWTAGRRHGKGGMDYPDNSKYVGTWYNGSRHGLGLASWEDGSRYEGSFVNDQVHGWGVMTYPSGMVFKGTYVEGRRNGWGQAFYTDGSLYSGGWRDDIQHGTGIWEKDGFQYDGGWVYGVRQGTSCTFSTPSGLQFEGVFINDFPSGKGQLKVDKVGTYIGEFVNGRKHGSGKFSLLNGCEYDGQWTCDVINGVGRARFALDTSVREIKLLFEQLRYDTVLYFNHEHKPPLPTLDEQVDKAAKKDVTPKGDEDAVEEVEGLEKLQGEEGPGGEVPAAQEEETKSVVTAKGDPTLPVPLMEKPEPNLDEEEYEDDARRWALSRIPGAVVYEGEWEMGRIHGKGKMLYRDGSVYDGEWRDDIESGEGTKSYPNREKYVGSFVFGKREGLGKHTYRDGRVYDGQWFDDKREGSGTVTYPDGRVFAGEFSRDVMLVGGKYTIPKHTIPVIADPEPTPKESGPVDDELNGDDAKDDTLDVPQDERDEENGQDNEEQEGAEDEIEQIQEQQEQEQEQEQGLGQGQVQGQEQEQEEQGQELQALPVQEEEDHHTPEKDSQAETVPEYAPPEVSTDSLVPPKKKKKRVSVIGIEEQQPVAAGGALATQEQLVGEPEPEAVQPEAFVSIEPGDPAVPKKKKKRQSDAEAVPENVTVPVTISEAEATLTTQEEVPAPEKRKKKKSAAGGNETPPPDVTSATPPLGEPENVEATADPTSSAGGSKKKKKRSSVEGSGADTASSSPPVEIPKDVEIPPIVSSENATPDLQPEPSAQIKKKKKKKIEDAVEGESLLAE